MPWTEPGRLQPMGLQTVRHDWAHHAKNIGDPQGVIQCNNWHLMVPLLSLVKVKEQSKILSNLRHCVSLPQTSSTKSKTPFASRLYIQNCLLLILFNDSLKERDLRALSKVITLWFDVHIKFAPKMWALNHGSLSPLKQSMSCAHETWLLVSSKPSISTFSSRWTLLRGPGQRWHLK